MKWIFAAAILILGISVAQADQQTLKIGTGKSTGTYSSFFKSIQAKCGSDTLQLIEVNSNGCDDNIDAAINKQTDAFFCQADTIQFISMNDPRASSDQIRLLVPLYPEEVHVIALRTLGKQEGGFTIPGWGKTVGGTVKQLDSLADLGGLTVGAWGGSYTTSRAIALLGSVQYDTKRFDDDKQALDALNKGEIAAIIAVGGQPLGFAKSLNTKYKLLKIDASLAAKVKAYQTARLSYKNLDASGVETVAPRSMLFVKNYTTPARRAAIAELKACIQANIGEFKEGTGHHPKWSDVDLEAASVWPLYDVGSAKPAAAIPAKKGK